MYHHRLFPRNRYGISPLSHYHLWKGVHCLEQSMCEGTFMQGCSVVAVAYMYQQLLLELSLSNLLVDFNVASTVHLSQNAPILHKGRFGNIECPH